MDQGNTMIMMDRVPISLPTPEEMPTFEKWLKANNIKEPFHPDQHYDYVGAFRAGKNATDGHFPDTFKLPGHPTFSVESKYYKPGMPAGVWKDEQYIPIDRPEWSKQMKNDVYRGYLNNLPGVNTQIRNFVPGDPSVGDATDMNAKDIMNYRDRIKRTGTKL